MLDVLALFVAFVALAVAVWNTHHTSLNSRLMRENTKAMIENSRLTSVNSGATEANTEALAANTAAALVAAAD
jgi:hypothetical protein